ncbi:MAG: J domain-containing protein [Parachlamydiaceae bacterium]
MEGSHASTIQENWISHIINKLWHFPFRVMSEELSAEALREQAERERMLAEIDDDYVPSSTPPVTATTTAASSSSATASSSALTPASSSSSSSTPAASSSSSSIPLPTSSIDDPAPDVDSFLRDLTALERTTEVTRINSAFKLNPLDIMNLDHRATKEEVTKSFRQASLQVHPDKFPAGEQRDLAQKAFALLGRAKDQLLDEAEREKLDELVDQARQKVLTNYAAGETTKKRKVVADKSEGDEATAVNVGDDASLHPLYDSWIRTEVKEILIEREWRKRQLLKAAAHEESLAAAEKKRRAEEKEAKDAENKQWEEGRDNRINSWRDFQKGSMKFKKKMPKTSKE